MTRGTELEESAGEVVQEKVQYSGLICNCSPKVLFEEEDDEEDDEGNCKRNQLQMSSL